MAAKVILAVICFLLICVCAYLISVINALYDEKRKWNVPIVPYDWDVELAKKWEEEEDDPRYEKEYW